jgi:hypothetical protein
MIALILPVGMCSRARPRTGSIRVPRWQTPAWRLCQRQLDSSAIARGTYWSTPGACSQAGPTREGWIHAQGGWIHAQGGWIHAQRGWIHARRGWIHAQRE